MDVTVVHFILFYFISVPTYSHQTKCTDGGTTASEGVCKTRTQCLLSGGVPRGRCGLLSTCCTCKLYIFVGCRREDLYLTFFVAFSPTWYFPDGMQTIEFALQTLKCLIFRVLTCNLPNLLLVSM